MITVKVTDEMIRSWQDTGNMTCPIAQAIHQWLATKSTRISHLTQADAETGAVLYKAGDQWYMARPRDSEKHAIQNFIATVDNHRTPRRRVFHYTVTPYYVNPYYVNTTPRN